MKHTISPSGWAGRSQEELYAQRVALYRPTLHSLYGQYEWDATTATILPTTTNVMKQPNFSKEKQ
jgi:hypothetical protein